MGETIGDRAVEATAIAWIVDLERSAGREPEDTRFAGARADLISRPRILEVKASGTSCGGDDLWLETYQYQDADRTTQLVSDWSRTPTNDNYPASSGCRTSRRGTDE